MDEQYQCLVAWNFGKTIAMNEMPLQLKGMHQDKHITIHKSKKMGSKQGKTFQKDNLPWSHGGFGNPNKNVWQ